MQAPMAPWHTRNKWHGAVAAPWMCYVFFIPVWRVICSILTSVYTNFTFYFTLFYLIYKGLTSRIFSFRFISSLLRFTFLRDSHEHFIWGYCINFAKKCWRVLYNEVKNLYLTFTSFYRVSLHGVSMPLSDVTSTNLGGHDLRLCSHHLSHLSRSETTTTGL